MESRDLSIEGVDGSVWPLYGLRAYGRDVAIIADGLDLGDLYMPPTEIITSAAAFQVGATPRKVRQDRRLIPMTVGTKGASIRGQGVQPFTGWKVGRVLQKAQRCHAERVQLFSHASGAGSVSC